MSEYYGAPSTPMSDFLAHYGVRGMKWGVRKAIAYGNQKKLGKVYKKAQKKLEKLNRMADVNNQKTVVQVHGKKALRSGLATAGAGGLAAYTAKFVKPTITGTTHTFTFENGQTVYKELQTIHEGTVAPHAAAVGATALGLGKTAYHVGKALAAKGRTTAKGHAKAVAKRDAWKKEMNSAFKGTSYDASKGSMKKIKSNNKMPRLHVSYHSGHLHAGIKK